MTTDRLSLEERSDILASVIQAQAMRRWRVSSQTATQAQLVRGQRVNHVLHLLLTIITLGLWAIVWLIVAATGGERHLFVSVDEYGNVTPAALSPRPRIAPVLATNARAEQIDHVVADLTRHGWKVTTRSETAASLEKKTWLPPAVKHYSIAIDEAGNLVRAGS